MTISVGINGFGRMGRLATRVLVGDEALALRTVNEIAVDAAGSAHLLAFDSVHGRWRRPCAGDDDRLYIDDVEVAYSSSPNIADANWRGCDVVIEATGKHHKKPGSLAAYFEQGVGKVVVAAPTEGACNIVMGVNHDDYRPAEHDVVTAASCTTNCLAPVVKVMHEQVGIVHGSFTTVHDVTNTQFVVDKGHRDLRRARSSLQSLIPTTTGSAKAIGRIFPDLAGRLDGHAVRVPLLNASLTDFVFEAARPVTTEEVNRYFREAAEGPLAGILGYEERPLVSADYLDDPRSAVVDGLSTLVVNGTQVKVYAWYDNEWGYVNRLVELVKMVAGR